MFSFWGTLYTYSDFADLLLLLLVILFKWVLMEMMVASFFQSNHIVRIVTLNRFCNCSCNWSEWVCVYCVYSDLSSIPFCMNPHTQRGGMLGWRKHFPSIFLISNIHIYKLLLLWKIKKQICFFFVVFSKNLLQLCQFEYWLQSDIVFLLPVLIVETISTNSIRFFLSEIKILKYYVLCQ